MLYRDEEKFKLMPFLAKYKQHGEAVEQHVQSKGELKKFETMKHITGLTFTEAEYETGVVERLEEVENYPANQFQTVASYVIDNEIAEGTSLALKKQNDLMEESLLELTMMMMEGM